MVKGRRGSKGSMKQKGAIKIVLTGSVNVNTEGDIEMSSTNRAPVPLSGKQDAEVSATRTGDSAQRCWVRVAYM